MSKVIVSLLRKHNPWNPFVWGNQNTRFSIIYLHRATKRKQFVQMKNLRLSRNPGRVFSLPMGTQSLVSSFPFAGSGRLDFRQSPDAGQAVDLHFNKREREDDIICYKGWFLISYDLYVTFTLNIHNITFIIWKRAMQYDPSNYVYKIIYFLCVRSACYGHGNSTKLDLWM